ncbi:MAG: nitrous oxide reductase accessory protein NosL [Thermodesulfobacteriota bacterium]
MKRYFFGMILSAALLLAISTPHAEEAEPVLPEKTAKCPVCGMFVAKYPDWIAEIIFQDGKVVFFDGAKDLFKYYFDIDRYAPEKTREDIRAVYVTTYYELELIDAKAAFFVVGSDVYGPMGHELIPHKNTSDAEAFSRDHGGKKTVKFGDIDPELIQSLD